MMKTALCHDVVSSMLIFRRIFFLTNLIVVALGCSTIFVESVPIIDGIKHNSFGVGEEVPLYIDSLVSSRTQLPIDYQSLPLCQHSLSSLSTSLQNKDDSNTLLEPQHLNFGQKLVGHRIHKSPYKLRMKTDSSCEILCVAELSSDDSLLLQETIENDYYQNWIVDNLNAASVLENDAMITTRYFRGIPVGFRSDSQDFLSYTYTSGIPGTLPGELYIYNHANIQIYYNRVSGKEEERYEVLRFLVNPLSINYNFTMTEREGGDDEGDWQNIIFQNPVSFCDRNRSIDYLKHTDFESVMREGMRPQKATGNVLFTYDVQWIENVDLQWSQRWEIYLTMDHAIPGIVHWGSLFNSSVVLVVLVTFGLAIAICRLRRAAKLTPLEMDEDFEDTEQPVVAAPASQTTQNAEAKWRSICRSMYKRMTCLKRTDTTKWRVLHADVFRPPSFSPFWFCVACGTGAHLLTITFLYLVLCVLGVISEARRGSLIQATILIFPLGGFFGGYVTRRFCQICNIEGANNNSSSSNNNNNNDEEEDEAVVTSNEDDENVVVATSAIRLRKERKQNMANLATLATALCFQELCFLLFMSIQYASRVMNSTLSISMSMIIVLTIYENVLTLLLTCLGAHKAANASTIVFPTETRGIPRPIPKKGLCGGCAYRFLMMIVNGILPFSAFFVDLYYLMAANWMHYHYFSFEFLMAVCLLMVLTCGMANILTTYFLLCRENHRWWWNSWSNGCATGLFVFLYSLVYEQQLEGVGWFAHIMYLGSMVLSSLAIALMLGFVGVTSSLWFTMIIYNMIVQNA